MGSMSIATVEEVALQPLPPVAVQAGAQRDRRGHSEWSATLAGVTRSHRGKLFSATRAMVFVTFQMSRFLLQTANGATLTWLAFLICPRAESPVWARRTLGPSSAVLRSPLPSWPEY